MEPFVLDLETQHPNTIKILDQFDIYRVPYKHVSSKPIYAFIVLPKAMPSGPRPLFVRYHGGGWTEGEADASLRPFFLEMTRDAGAVLIAPDYRLRPEHEMVDGLDDSRDFWGWLEAGGAQEALASAAATKAVQLDPTNLIVAGESAGGYHAAQVALLGMTSLPIKCLILQYPPLRLRTKLDDELARNGDHQVYERLVPYSVIEEYLAALEPGHVLSRAKFGSRMDMLAAMMQADKLCDLEGDNAYLDPWNSLDTAPKLPPILLYHSKEDEALPWQYTEDWAAKLKSLQPDVPLYLTWQKGEHVFDKNDNLETPWLKEPLEFARKYWPA